MPRPLKWSARRRENSSMAWGVFYQTVNIGGKNTSLTLEDLFLTSIIQNAIRCKNAKSMMLTLEWIRDLDLARRKETQAAKANESRISREMIAKMTDQERTDLYFKTLRQIEPRPEDEDLDT